MGTGWRRVRRTRSSLGPILGLLASMLAAMLVLLTFWRDSELWWLIVPLMTLVFFVGGFVALLRLVVLVEPTVARVWPAVTTPPPPEGYDGKSGLTYSIKPGLYYPLLALARRQSGWVAIQVRLRPDGRPHQYRIDQQAPGRTFETAIDRGLPKARFNIPPGTDLTAAHRSLITFVTVGPTRQAPDWVIARLPPEDRPPETAA